MSTLTRARAAARRHPRVAATALLAVAVGLPVGWYLGSPIFIRTSLVEPAPSIAAIASPTPALASPSQAPAASAAPTATAWLGSQWTGTFHGTDDFHFGRGTARLIETAPGTYTVRFEGFSVRNGPDLYVYLSPSVEGYVDGAIEVGRLKATDGDFNTAVPAGTDVSGVRSVLIWCKQFSHLFAVAPLR